MLGTKIISALWINPIGVFYFGNDNVSILFWQ